MDSLAQFKIAAVEAPSTLNALCIAKSLAKQRVMEGRRALLPFTLVSFTLSVLRAVERVSPSGEFRRGCLRFPFSVERVLSESAGDGEELAPARVFFTVLVGADFLPSLVSPKEPGVRWALDCLAARHRSHGAFLFCSRIL